MGNSTEHSLTFVANIPDIYIPLKLTNVLLEECQHVYFNKSDGSVTNRAGKSG